jgi:hypothetical protein
MKDIYIEGGQIMVELIKNYDRERGSQHNFLSIPRLTKNFSKHWAAVFTLD